MKQIRHRIIKRSIRYTKPLHILLVLAARDVNASTTEEVLLFNFCERPGRIDMDH